MVFWNDIQYIYTVKNIYIPWYNWVLFLKIFKWLSHFWWTFTFRSRKTFTGKCFNYGILICYVACCKMLSFIDVVYIYSQNGQWSRVNTVGTFPWGKFVVPVNTRLIYVNGRLIIVCFQETVIQYSYGWNVNTFINIFKSLCYKCQCIF